MDLSLQADSHCSVCAAEICMRQQLINLAIGHTGAMYCLPCLGKRENVRAEHLLAKIKNYILSRQCFQKEWVKYKDISSCPDPVNCLPHNHGS